jgi:hypothetical protein
MPFPGIVAAAQKLPSAITLPPTDYAERSSSQDHARRALGKLFYASSGAGSVFPLNGEQLKMLAGVQYEASATLPAFHVAWRYQHRDTVNAGEHTIHAGGRYDSHLLVPVIAPRA